MGDQAVKETETGGKFTTLILEDDREDSTVMAQALRQELPEALVLTARTLTEARMMLTKYKVHFAIVDLMLPDGSGIDFLHDVQTQQPNTGIAIVTGTQLPEYREQASAFGVLNFLEKPIKLQVLLSVVRSHHEQNYAPRVHDETTFFSASLTSLTTLDIIQLKCLSHATIVLDFISRRHGVGRVYFENGEVIHAETPTLRGVDAFNEIVGWRGGQVLEVHDAPQVDQTVEGHWQNLLMNAVQLADEARQEE